MPFLLPKQQQIQSTDPTQRKAPNGLNLFSSATKLLKEEALLHLSQLSHAGTLITSPTKGDGRLCFRQHH